MPANERQLSDSGLNIGDAPDNLALKTAEGLTQVGLSVLKLASPNMWSRWIRRRWERIDFLNDSTFRRQVILDVDLSAARELISGDSGTPLWKSQLLLPLAMLEKAPHRTFEVWDETGARLPRLNKPEGKELMRHGIVALGQAVLERGGYNPEANEWKSTVVQAIDVSPTSHKHPIQGSQSENQAMDTLKEAREKLIRLREDATEGSDLRLILSNNAFFYLAMDLVDHFYLLVPCSGGEVRKVVTYSYEEFLEPRLKEGSLRQRALISLRGPAYPFRLFAPAVGHCDSFHIEVNAPPDLEITDARLEVQPASPSEPASTFVDDDNLPSKAHIYCSVGRLVREAKFTATFHSVGAGLVRSSFVTTSFIMLVLWAGAIAMSWGWLGGVGVTTLPEVDPSSATSLLLIVPGIIATYLAQPSKHNLTSKVFYKTRFLVGIMSTMSYFGAAFLAVGMRGTLLRILWGIVTIIATCCWFALFYKWNFNRKRIRVRDNARQRQNHESKGDRA